MRFRDIEITDRAAIWLMAVILAIAVAVTVVFGSTSPCPSFVSIDKAHTLERGCCAIAGPTDEDVYVVEPCSKCPETTYEGDGSTLPPGCCIVEGIVLTSYPVQYPVVPCEDIKSEMLVYEGGCEDCTHEWSIQATGPPSASCDIAALVGAAEALLGHLPDENAAEDPTGTIDSVYIPPPTPVEALRNFARDLQLEARGIEEREKAKEDLRKVAASCREYVDAVERVNANDMTAR